MVAKAILRTADLSQNLALHSQIPFSYSIFLLLEDVEFCRANSI